MGVRLGSVSPRGPAGRGCAWAGPTRGLTLVAGSAVRSALAHGGEGRVGNVLAAGAARLERHAAVDGRVAGLAQERHVGAEPLDAALLVGAEVAVAVEVDLHAHDLVLRVLDEDLAGRGVELDVRQAVVGRVAQVGVLVVHPEVGELPEERLQVVLAVHDDGEDGAEAGLRGLGPLLGLATRHGGVVGVGLGVVEKDAELSLGDHVGLRLL